MKICSELKNHEVWQGKDGVPDARFAAHASACPSCRETLRKWQVLEKAVRVVDADLTGDIISSPYEAEQLVRRARSLRAPSPRYHVKKWGLAGAAAAAVVVLTVGGYLLLSPDDGQRVQEDAVIGSGVILAAGNVEKFVIDHVGQQIRVPQDARAVVSLGGDTAGLDGNTRVRIDRAAGDDTRILLEQGAVSCAVTPRKPAARFVVVSGDVEVRVKGTRFSVERRGDVTEVAVDEGRVEVALADGKNQSVDPGQQLAVGSRGFGDIGPISEKNRRQIVRLLSEQKEDIADLKTVSSELPEEMAFDIEEVAQDDSPPPRGKDILDGVSKKPGHGDRPRATSSDLKTWREWIIDGRTTDATLALEAHLKRKPGDSAAWSLLADCRRKTGQWRQAVDAYEQVISSASAGDAGRARFRAGAILQDRLSDHRRAAELFEAYVSSVSGSMKAEGMVRLARSYRALGKEDDARRVLRTVIREHKGTTAATRARNMLSAGANPVDN